MTKATPQSVTLRSFSRISANRIDRTAKNAVSKPVDKQSSLKKMKKKVSTEKSSKAPVVNIHDFKKQSGKTVYLVERDEPNNDTWETEDMIESLDVLSAYQQKVFEETGYPINDQSNGSDEQPQQEQDNSRQRPSRASKTRAVIALKHSDFIDVDEDEDEDKEVDEDITRSTKRKSLKGSGGTRKAGIKRKTKAEVLLETQLEERLERKRSRERLNPEAIICSLDHFDYSDCCLQCGANTARRALEKNDLNALDKAFKNEALAHYSGEDKPNGLAFIEYAIVLQRPEFADALEQYNKDYSNKYDGHPERVKPPAVPQKYIVYSGGNTGRNNRVGEYHRRSFRQVEESRGNRVGNSAFYRDQSAAYTPRKTYMNVEDQMRNSPLRPFMPYISTPTFQDPKVIDNYLVHFQNGSSEVYFAIASGSRLLAKSLLERAKGLGRSTFNHLHEEVLKFVDGESLTSYRKSQISKMASDAYNVSPYHCSAINPSAKYLTEFFEALDPAERLETDVFGRSIAFYAAVSETSECLEFIESKGINLSLVDKYKMSPLIQAARFGRSHNVEVLIKHLRGGPEVTTTSPVVFQTTNRNRRTALHYAAYFGHAETCRVLVNYDAPVEAVESLDKQTALIFAAKNGYVDCVRVLVEEGKSNPEKGDKFSRTPLHYACINGHIEVVKYLLSHGVNADAADSSNNTSIHFAAAFGYIKILHLLVEYGSADPSVCNVWRSTPCSVANMKGHIAIVKYLLNLPNTSIDVNFKDQEGCVMLQNNINEPVDTLLEKNSNVEKISLLLSMNADVNSVDLEGNTSLHTLVSNSEYSFLAPKGYNQMYSVNTSYYNKPDLDQDQMEGIIYQLKLARLLVEHGADLNAKNSNNETPLAVAMRNYNNYLVAFLIEAGSKFWTDVDLNNSNFFHYFGKIISYVSGIQPHNEDYTLIRDRHLEIINKIWIAVEKIAPLHMTEIQKTINEVNNEGISPIICSVQTAIRNQKKSMAREKSMILASCNDSNNYSYSSSSSVYPGPKFNEIPKPFEVNLRFDLKIWIDFMSKVVPLFKPDMNSYVQLPKDYKKKNPKVKKLNYPTHTGFTALHIAAETQCTDLIQFLLKNGSSPNAKVNLQDEVLSGDTPMIIAYHHKKDQHQEVPSESLEYTEKVKKNFILTKPNFEDMLNTSIEILIKFDGCPYITDSKGASAVLKASACADFVNIATMCSAKPSQGTNINTANEEGETALAAAVKLLESKIKSKKAEEDIDIRAVSSLLNAQADPNIQDEDDNTILMKVIKTSYVPLLDIVLKNSVIPIDHDTQNKKHETALIIACKLNVPEIILCYIHHLKKIRGLFQVNVFDIDMGTPLAYAAKNGNAEIVRELLSLGADVNFNKPQHIPLIEAVAGKNIEVVEMVLKHGALVNVQDETFGNSPLHTAVLVEKHRIVKLLLENGADYNFQNKRKQTAMHLAIEATKRQTNRSFRVEHLLLKAGADANITDFFGRTPLHYVFVQSDLIPITRNTSVISKKVKQISKEIKIEQDRAASLNNYAETFDLNNLAGKLKEEENYLSSWIKEAKKIQIDLAEKEQQDKKSTEDKQEEEVIVLEEEKDLIKSYCLYGWETAAITPSRFDPIDILKYLSDFQGLNYDLKDDFGRTPLHYAACVGAFSCTSSLLNQKVDINALDSDNNGPLQLALRNNYVDYSVMLCNMGATVNNNIVLKDGETTSTFGFSLSQSLINIAYLIMEKGVTLIESIKDALINGKFHMVEILLQSAKDEALSQTLPTNGQNMWHIIADFKPFNNEIWEEYIEDIIERLLALNISISKDNKGRSPIHYAAKHGQTILLRRLLTMTNIVKDINTADEEGKSELYYAVESLNYDSVKELLNVIGASEKLHNVKEESLVLKAVKSNNFDLTQLLLQHGFPTDEDSSFGRVNAVMVACQNNDLKMLKLLIEHNADVNKPSHVEHKNKSGKKYTVLLHPIFAASVAPPVMLETLLVAGANPNVYGLESKSESRISCFMYNVVLDRIENQKILLDFNVDLNIIDTKSSRTIFYQFFFQGVMKKHKHKSKSGEANSKDNKLTFHESIFEKMMQNFRPQVNFVDKITNMTPLELAIRERNTIMAERLIMQGADANVESCFITNEFTASKVLNPNSRMLPAFIHAANENNMELLKIVLQQQNINWLWHDQDNHNIISYIVGHHGGLSRENVDILKYIAEEMKMDTFKKLIRMRDIIGKTPVDYAFERNNKTLCNAIIEIDPSSTITRDTLETEEQNDENNMDIDYISTQKVDEDAQIERDILQRKKDLEKAKDNTTEEEVEDNTPKVDPYSNLEKVGSIMLDENNQAYDIMLIKVEIRSWGMYTDTSFYKMSIINNKVLNLYVLWTRWGSYGDEGQHQKTPFLTLEEAVSEFKSIFKSKTGNAWEDRLTSFQHKQGRYEPLQISKHPRDTIIKDFDFLDSKLPVQLPTEVINLMKLICNFNYLSNVYSASCVDMPLGQVPQRTLDRAQQLLQEASEMSKKRIEAGSNYTDKAKIQEAKMWDFKIAQHCVEYARLLPRNDGTGKTIRSLFDHHGENLKREIARMADLSYVGFAANVVLAAKHHINEINPLEYAYHTLNCSFRNISFDSHPSEYQLVKNYMQSTSQGNQELVHLMAINRADEESRFRPFEKEANRQLLWHGSRIGNFMGILKQGLRISPRTSSSNGAMLGSGVYFADTFSKSLNYATDYYGDHHSAYKLMLLCEVALGSKTSNYEFAYNNNDKQFENLDSVKGEGSNIPDPNNAVYDANGVYIPMGPCISYSRPVEEDNTSSLFGRNHCKAGLLNQNEYAVYNEDRVKIRYLLIIRDTSRCYLCSKSNKTSMKPFHEHDVKKYNYSAFNSFEAEVTKAYLNHNNKSPQDVFDQELEQYIESGLYKKKWNTPLDVSKESKVCQECAYNVTGILLEKKMTSIDADVPELLKTLPQCKYGKECRTQTKVSHAKKYQHWFHPNISESSSENTTAIENNVNSSSNHDSEAEDMDTDAEEEDGNSMDTDEE